VLRHPVSFLLAGAAVVGSTRAAQSNVRTVHDTGGSVIVTVPSPT
jgi:hypothetical protein